MNQLSGILLAGHVLVLALQVLFKDEYMNCS